MCCMRPACCRTCDGIYSYAFFILENMSWESGDVEPWAPAWLVWCEWEVVLPYLPACLAGWCTNKCDWSSLIRSRGCCEAQGIRKPRKCARINCKRKELTRPRLVRTYTSSFRANSLAELPIQTWLSPTSRVHGFFLQNRRVELSIRTAFVINGNICKVRVLWKVDQFILGSLKYRGWRLLP